MNLIAIDHGDIDHITDAAIAAQINVCDPGLGHRCRRCLTEPGLGSCAGCQSIASRKHRCIYCGRPVRLGRSQECFGDQTEGP